MNQKNYSYYFNFLKKKVFLEELYKNLPNFLDGCEINRGLPVLVCNNKNLFFLINYLLKHHQVNHFIDSTALDFAEKKFRFNLIYFFRKIVINFLFNAGIFFKPYEFTQSFFLGVETSVSELDMVPSISLIFPGSNWAEREMWDLYGIFFSNHPDLRRILTDYGFQGHPFRKDFPLTGYVELRYDSSKQRVVYEPVQLAQEFRLFDFVSPWSQSKN